MKNFYFFIVIFFIISCQHDKKNDGKIKTHNPSNEIYQILINPEAKKLFEKASEKNKTGEYDSARIFLEKSLEYEKSPIIYNELGIASMAQKQFENAIKYYQKSIIVDSAYYPSYINLSRCYLAINEYEKGKKILINMISSCDSEYWKAYGNMFLALFYFNGDKDCRKARETLEKAAILKTDPTLVKQYMEFMDNIKKTCA